jgi:RNA polymerase sigma-70 factor, ECF subfamily
MEQISQEEILRQAINDQVLLTAYAYGMLKDWALAQDVVQESLIVVSAKWQSFHAGASVRAWVRGIVRLKTYEMLRHRGQETTFEDDALTKVIEKRFDAYCDEVQTDELERRKVALTKCLDLLKQRDRDMITKFYWNEESCKRLSDFTGRTVNALRLQLSRLRQKIKLCVERRLAVEQI